nr:hypothetical protein [uncultured Mucilaginibacter sp.]
MLIRCCNYPLSIAIALAFALVLNGCQEKSEPKDEAQKTPSRPSAQAKEMPEIPRDSISLFILDEVITKDEDTAAFVSVSDIDRLPGDYNSPADSVDRLVIPSLENKEAKDTRHLTLTSKYRKRLLSGTGISETDSLFVYDYGKDVLLSFAISSLDAVAKLSVYEDETVAQHSARDYMLGFKIDRAALVSINNRYPSTSYVYIGAKNPFTRNQMHPIVWKRTDPKNFPSIPLRTEDREILKGFKLTGSYTFQSDRNHFYLQDFVNKESHCERVIICDVNGKIIRNELLTETEGTSPARLSFASSKTKMYEQWTGRLLKNKPPLTLGFEYISFGCPVLSFVNESHGFVEVNCDNRH